MNVHPLNSGDEARTRHGSAAKVVAIALIVAALVAINALVIG